MENSKYIAQGAFLSVFFDDSSDSDDSEEDDLVVETTYMSGYKT